MSPSVPSPAALVSFVSLLANFGAVALDVVDAASAAHSDDGAGMMVLMIMAMMVLMLIRMMMLMMVVTMTVVRW